jgi:renal tumor antigen
LYLLLKDQRNYFTNEKVANFMYQLLKAVDVLHANNFFHRDIKPENILIKGDLLKLADFGSARLINTAQPYTEYISTR